MTLWQRANERRRFTVRGRPTGTDDDGWYTVRLVEKTDDTFAVYSYG